MKMLYLALAFFSVTIASVSQIILKRGAQKNYKNKIREYLNPYVMTGYGLLFFSMMLTIAAYRKLSFLSVAVMEAVGFVLVPVLSIYFFNEKISKNKLIGILCILTGVILYNL